MRPLDKKIDKMFAQAELKTNSNVDNVVLDDAIKALSQSKPSKSKSRPNIWSIIMQNKMTKYVSAAIVIFAIFISIQFLPGTELNATELLAKVSKNMLQFKIVKSITENYLPGKTEPVDSEISIIDYNRKQCFKTYSRGYLHQMDYDKMIWSVYRPEDNSMVVKPLVGEWREPDEQVEEYIKKLSQEGIEVHLSELLNDGVKLSVIEYDEILNNLSVDPNKYMSNTMMNNTTVRRIHTKLIINRDQLFLSQGEMSYYDSQDNLIVTKKKTREPAETSPVDIYELGVPADVKIINQVPDKRVQEVRNSIEKHKSSFLKNYIAIQLENDVESNGSESLVEGMVIYSQGKKLRVDVFRREYSSDSDKKAMFDQVMALMTDSKIRIQPFISQEFLPSAIRIYDGLWQYELNDYSGQFIVREPLRRPEGDLYGDDDIDDFGWRTLWMLNEPEWMYEDDFSVENDLVAIEVTWQSKFGRVPERKVLHVDPNKDYMFRRYREEKLVDAPWQTDKSWIEEAQNKDQLNEEVRVYDVTEYGQTTSGQWYPKTITIKGYDSWPLREYSDHKERIYDFNRISRIYLLEENPDLPDELFDPNQLSILDTEKQ